MDREIVSWVLRLPTFRIKGVGLVWWKWPRGEFVEK